MRVLPRILSEFPVWKDERWEFAYESYIDRKKPDNADRRPVLPSEKKDSDRQAFRNRLAGNPRNIKKPPKAVKNRIIF
ncbi:hypothetical protein CH378_04600 [Leptospira kmetyi]|uniref:Uncharacterized protein n=1 Tax=Leptospira kmetyi TaxID=408139 RepID=A0ABX4NCI2_9LEPT|nr:hypothetical protein CH378_04600 [Leptospira kmetyi]